jgi:hypothetical protein
VVAVAVCVVAGTVGLLATFGHPFYVFTGDQPLLAMRVVDTLGFHATTGPYSRFGWSHPGPAMFYLLAPVYAVLGRNPRAFFVGSLLLNGACAVATVAVVRRMAGEWASRWVAALLCLFVLAGGITLFESFWNPYLEAGPLLLALVLAAAACTGSPLSLLGLLLAGSYAVQTDVGTAPVVLAIGVLGGAGFVVTRVRRWRWQRQQSTRAEAWRPSVAAIVAGAVGLVALVVMWMPPLSQQLHGHPGNITAMLHFFEHPPRHVTGGSHHSFGQALAAMATTTSAVPYGGDAAAHTITTTNVAHNVLLAVSMVVAVAAAVVALWRRRLFLFGLACTTLVTVPVAIYSATRIVGPVFPYLLSWAAYLTLPGLAAAGVLIGAEISHVLPATWRQGVPRRVAAISGALVMLVPVGLLAGQLALRPPTRIDNGDPPVARLAAFARAHLPAKNGTRPLVVIGSLTRWPVATGLVWQLERDGLQPVVTPDWEFMFTSRDTESGRPTWEIVVEPPPAPSTTPGAGPPQLTLDTGAFGPTTVMVQRVR